MASWQPPTLLIAAPMACNAAAVRELILHRGADIEARQLTESASVSYGPDVFDCTALGFAVLNGMPLIAYGCL